MVCYLLKDSPYLGPSTYCRKYDMRERQPCSPDVQAKVGVSNDVFSAHDTLPSFPYKHLPRTCGYSNLNFVINKTEVWRATCHLDFLSAS